MYKVNNTIDLFYPNFSTLRNFDAATTLNFFLRCQVHGFCRCLKPKNRILFTAKNPFVFYTKGKDKDPFKVLGHKILTHKNSFLKSKLSKL